MLSNLHKAIQQRRDRKNLYSSPAYWNSKADSYNETSVSMWPNQTLNSLYEDEQKRLINLYLSDVSRKVLLDLGCGTGRFSRWFASEGADVTGMDFSAGALDIAARQTTGNNPTYYEGSVFELDGKNAYDVVFTWGVLTIACRDKEQLLDALVRVRGALKPDGRLLLTEPVHRGFLHRVLDLDLSEFLDVMREAGFEIKTTTPLHFWPMRLVLCYVPWPAWITTPLYHFGQAAMKLPGLSKLGDYWAILASPAEFSKNLEEPHTNEQ